MIARVPRVVLDSPWLTIYDPWTIPAGHHGLELLLLLGFAVTLRHAVRSKRAGDAYGVFLWLTALFYGVWMEVVSYHTVDNFVHDQFTVMLYHKRLPLYVVMLYPAFIYTAVQTARRLGMRAPGTFFAAGMLVVLIDVPFDIVGPDLRWWWWREDAEDPLGLVAHRWLGVPVTSYCWHLLFCGSLAITSARMQRLAGSQSRASALRVVAVAAMTGALSIVVGVIAMMPFHVFRGPLGLSDGTFTVTLFVVAAVVVALARRRGAHAADPAASRGAQAFVIVWHVAFVGYGALVWPGAGIADPAWKAAVVLAVAVASVAAHGWLHGRGRQCETGGHGRG